jgi:hypothetical protein
MSLSIFTRTTPNVTVKHLRLIQPLRAFHEPKPLRP